MYTYIVTDLEGVPWNPAIEGPPSYVNETLSVREHFLVGKTGLFPQVLCRQPTSLQPLQNEVEPLL